MKYITSIWSTFALASLLILMRIIDPSLLEQTRLNTFDALIKTLPEEKSQEIVLLNIGEDSLAELGQFPWPRHHYAQMIADLRNKNAGMIGFTIMFPEADRFGGDEVFASWVKDNGIILTQTADEYGRSESAPYVGYATFGTSDPLDFIYQYKGLVTNIPEIEAGAWGHGLSNGAPEVDSITRRIPLISNVNGQLYPSFALETTRVLNEKQSYTIKSNESGIESIVLRPFNISTDSDGSIWLKWNTKFEEVEYVNNLNDYEDFKGRTVIVGVTARGLSQQVATPGGLKYPHQLQASALQTILSDKPISRPQYATPLEILVGTLLVFVLILVVYRLPIWVSLLTFLVLCGGTIFSVLYIWNKSYILLDLTFHLILYILSFTSAGFNNFYKQFVLRQQIKKQFETYLDPRQVMLLQKDPSLLRLGGERKEMSFLFMDIVGFTPISEHYKNNDDPEGLVEIINNYLDTMTKIILKNGGTVDKYMGDCIMAFWNAPLPSNNHADMAVKTAYEITEAADVLIAELEEKGLPRIDVGIGINTGDCIVGNMGSESRFDYSVIGDAVNLAARLEGQTRNYDGVRVLLSQFTAEECKGRSFTEVDTITVKGKSEQITIYT
jgi:adenylate cyclase